MRCLILSPISALSLVAMARYVSPSYDLRGALDPPAAWLWWVVSVYNLADKKAASGWLVLGYLQ